MQISTYRWEPPKHSFRARAQLQGFAIEPGDRGPGDRGPGDFEPFNDLAAGDLRTPVREAQSHPPQGILDFRFWNLFPISPILPISPSSLSPPALFPHPQSFTGPFLYANPL